MSDEPAVVAVYLKEKDLTLGCKYNKLLKIKKYYEIQEVSQFEKKSRETLWLYSALYSTYNSHEFPITLIYGTILCIFFKYFYIIQLFKAMANFLITFNNISLYHD